MGGFLERIGKIATGVGGAIQSPFGLVKDLALGAFTDDDEFDGFVGTLYGSVTKRGGQLFGNVLGPEEGLGAAIGGLPGAVRTPARTAINPVLESLETVGREAVREPLTAAVTAASLYQAGEGFDLGQGYKIAQDRSLGQSIALAVLTEDITDDAEVAEAMGTDWYESISGTFDAAARLFLEPDVLLFGGVTAARRAGVAATSTQALAKVPGAAGLVEKGVFGRTIKTKKDVEAALAHPALPVINDKILELRREEGVLDIADPDVLPVPVRVVEPGVGLLDEGLPEAARPSVATPIPAAEGMPPLFHGTPRPIEGGRLDTTGAFDRHARNLFGSGFYSTSSPDIAQSYVKKDAGRAGANLNPTTYGVRWTGDVPPKVLDLEAPRPPVEAAEPFRQFINSDDFHTAEMAVDDIAEVNRLIDEGAPLSEVYAATKEAMSGAGIRVTEADEIIQSLNGQINAAGFDALRYQGGKYAAKGQGEAHDAYIWLDPGKVEISKFDQPKATGPRQGPPEPKVTEVTPPPATRNEAAVDRTAARIRDLAFPDHRDGAIISRVLAEADDLPTAWGALMGDRASMETLFATRADLAGRISRISGDQARIDHMKRMVGVIGPDQLPLELPGDIKMIEASQKNVEIDQLYDIEAKLAYHEKANAAVREIPRISATSERRSQFTRSEFFQSSPLAVPLRLAVNMRPRNMVDLHDPAGDAQVTRLLRKARLPLEMQDELRGRYMSAADPTARNRVLAQAEAASIRSIAARHGITDQAEIDKLVAAAERGRTHSMAAIAGSRQYDGAGRAYIEDIGDDGVVSKVYLPISATQEFNQYLLPDLDAIDDVLRIHGQDITRVGAVKAGAGEFLEAYQRLWKPSVLLRVGWPLRVVGEEQVRIMSQIGALLTAGKAAVALTRYGKDLGVEQINNVSQAIRRVPKSERTFKGDLGRAEAAKRRGLRTGTMNIRGNEVESAWGTNETFNDISRQMNSAGASMNAVVQTADDLRNGLRREVMGEWQSLDPTTPGYSEAWEHGVNRQIGQDEMWRQFLEGKTLDEVRDWAETTAAGRAYLKRVPHWRNRLDDWLDIAEQTANDYLPTPELKRLALDGKARISHLEQIIPDAAGRPTVHGAVIKEVQGRSRIGVALTKMRDEAMRVLGTIPTDVLSRQPYFDHHYTQEVTRLIDLAADQGMDLTPDILRGYEAKARSFALGESKKLLYDLADSSELAHTLRFIAPFYCVDDQTQALTRRGWLWGHELTTDDIVLSMDPATKELRWSPVRRIFRKHYSGEMFRIRSGAASRRGRIDALVTPGHKFAMSDGRLLAVEALRQRQRIQTMGEPLASEGEILSDAFVEVVGWAVTEGHYKRGGTTIEISQSTKANPDKVERIRGVLKRAGAHWHEFQAGVDHQIRYFGVTGFMAQMIKQVAPNRVMTSEFLGSLAPYQRGLLIETMIDADGTRRGQGGRVFVQKSPEAMDAFVMLCTLQGVQTVVTPKGPCLAATLLESKQVATSYLAGSNRGRGQGFRSGEALRRPTEHYEGTVWCPTTDHGTFVCRRNGVVYVTGNSAWQEVITRWTGIAVDNPAFVARLHEIWRAPERMGIVTDEDGNTLNADGTATSPLGDKVEPGRDRYVNMKLLASDNVVGKALFNDLTRNIPGARLAENTKFNKRSANLIAQGAPGVGPIVQIPLNEIAKGRPEIEDSVRWALPFGATQSTFDMVLPATLRRMKTKAGGEEDRLYSNQLMRIYWDMQVDYNLGKRTEAPTYGEAKKRTDSFYNVRTVASFVSPVAPSFQSPYQPYIDVYRALKEKDPETADEKFLLQFGEEFFPLTQSLSRSMDGIPPTLEGAAARDRYVDLIERHPGLGGLIIGAEGAGEFSSAVYQSQLAKPVAPGSSDKQRKAFSFEDAKAQPNERLGWAEYSKAMDVIDAERMNRGLPNLQVRAAQDLADLKRGVIASLEKKYPEWAQVFNVTDRGVWARKINGLREIAGDERLAGRAEISELRRYLGARDQVVDILAARKAQGGASTITAASNTDLKGVWDQITGRMVTNPAFASVFYRYLERDPLELETRSV